MLNSLVKRPLVFLFKLVHGAYMRVLIYWAMLRHGVSRFTAMQMVFYKRGTSNHEEHNANPDYWSVLLGELKERSFDRCNALDFACGKGRNVSNMLSLANWSRVDGVDISLGNIEFCQSVFDPGKSKFWVTSGSDLGGAPVGFYDFVVSTIALQHIPVYDIRRKILLSIFSSMRSGACFSFQMGCGEDLKDVYDRPRSGYFDNAYSAAGTNADHDVRITKPDEVVQDLLRIGFVNISYVIRPSYSDVGHPQWIYFRCYKS